MCNPGMDSTTLSDAQRIQDLGGAAAVATLLGYDKAAGGVQRVHNWTDRGIPSKVKLERPDLFLRPIKDILLDRAKTAA